MMCATNGQCRLHGTVSLNDTLYIVKYLTNISLCFSWEKFKLIMHCEQVKERFFPLSCFTSFLRRIVSLANIPFTEKQ